MKRAGLCSQGAQNLVETHPSPARLYFHGFPSSIGFSFQINPADIPDELTMEGRGNGNLLGPVECLEVKPVLYINKIPFNHYAIL